MPQQSVRNIRAELYSPEGPDGIWWLGNAGFVVRLGTTYVFIDPAVTEISHPGVEILHGFPLPVSDVEKADHVLYSHAHTDHMDPGFFPKLVELKSEVYAPEYCRSVLLEGSIPEEHVHIAKPGTSFSSGDLTIEIVRARHASRGHCYYDVDDQDTCACGFLIRTAKERIFHPGDTCYLKEFSQLDVDVLLLPINDTNLNAGFAALLTKELQPSIVIPCHYGMYPPPEDWQGGHPAEYLTAIAARGYSVPHTNIMVLQPGGCVILSGRRHSSEAKDHD